MHAHKGLVSLSVLPLFLSGLSFLFLLCLLFHFLILSFLSCSSVLGFVEQESLMAEFPITARQWSSVCLIRDVPVCWWMFDIDLHHPVLRADEVSGGLLWSVVNSQYHACHCFRSLKMDTKYVHDSQLQFKPLQFFVCFCFPSFLLSDWSFLSLDQVGI